MCYNTFTGDYMAKYIDLRKEYKKENLQEAANYIKNGKLVLFPTETVYGIGADGLNAEAVKNIFLAKGRNSDNPLILHVSDFKMVDKIACALTPLEKTLMKNFFPGPLTIVLKRKSIVPDQVTANLDTVGVRMPENKIAHDLIALANTPIAAPSANISGRPSGTNISDIFDELKDKVDYIIDGGETKVGLESTVIRVINNEIHILRPGKITYDDLKKYANVVIPTHILSQVNPNEKILSPGMKYKHYAPNTKCILVYSENKEKMLHKMQELETTNTLVITNKINMPYFKNSISYGSSLEEISHNIFKILRSVDKGNYDLVIIEGVKAEGLGLAIMNRLIRACSHNYIEL